MTTRKPTKRRRRGSTRKSRRAPKSLPDFQREFPNEAKCQRYLWASRIPNGWFCPHCGDDLDPYTFKNRPTVFRCRACKRDTSLTANTVMHRSRPRRPLPREQPRTRWTAAPQYRRRDRSSHGLSITERGFTPLPRRTCSNPCALSMSPGCRTTTSPSRSPAPNNVSSTARCHGFRAHPAPNRALSSSQVGSSGTDFEHYARHPDCKSLWCVIYDINHHLRNPQGSHL